MAYSTNQDIEKTLPPEKLAECTDDTNGTIVNNGIVTEQIAFADAEIDTYLRAKHTVPLATVPPTVRMWSVIIAIYNCYLRRLDLDIPETVQSRYDIVVTQMKAVRDSETIIDDSDSVQSAASFYKSNKTSDSRIFTVKDDESGVLDQYFSKSRITPNC